MSENNFYKKLAQEGGKAERLEAERLRGFDYPTQVSLEILGNPVGKRVLDVGAGDNTELGQHVNEHGGQSLVMDIRPNALANQAEAGNLAVCANISAIPLPDQSVDVYHARFVLAWLPPALRKLAIEEAVRVSRGDVHFLDYDWGVVEAEGAVLDFANLAINTLPKLGFDPFYGAKLKADVEAVLQELGDNVQVVEHKHQRGLLSDYPEIIKAATSLKFMAAKIPGGEALVGTLQDILTRLQEEEQMVPQPTYKMSDIVEVTARRS